MSQTGFEKSMYIHAYIQIILGISIIPFSLRYYVFLVISVLSTYIFAISMSDSPLMSLILGSHLVSLHLYIVMTFLLYFSINFVHARIITRQ
jgi:hypothetical protein